MDHEAQYPNREKIKTISHALRILNDATTDSSEEIRRMASKDFQKLKRVLSDVRPEIRSAFSEVKQASAQSIINMKDKVVSSTRQAARQVDEKAHSNPWYFVGGAAAVSTFLGYFLGRRFRD